MEQNNFQYPSGMEIWASDNSEQSIVDAKKYIAGEGYTSNEVKMVRRGSQILVVAR